MSNTVVDCEHNWVEEYYGYRCHLCGAFIPYGSEPWVIEEK